MPARSDLHVPDPAAGVYASAASDPRRSIGQLDDASPILLLPVRLETRFATTEAGPELRVRVYPDDIHIDTFDPALTETEMGHVRDYWARTWAARGVDGKLRGAWKLLVQQHGAGRAGYLVGAHVPSNPGDRPGPDPDRVALVISTGTPLAPAEATAVSTYWGAVWAGTAGADDALTVAVGQDRADTLRRDYRPVNLDDRDGTTAAVVYATFPSPTVRSHSWSVPPTAGALPQRFVVIGYHGADPPVVALGRGIPDRLPTGPDPTATGADALRHDANGELVLPDDLRWIADFDAAVAIGMGIRVPLTAAQAQAGFDRLLVVGVRLTGDGAADLADLLRRQAASRGGVALLAQGTPTNNTEAVPSGKSRRDDPDTTYDALNSPLYTVNADWDTKRDGQWLADLLGLAPDFFAHTVGADGTDQQAGRAMNRLLWPATLGYWMTTMMAPAFDADVIAATRDFFSRHVLGAGAVPAIQVGNQPYGILPTTAFSQMKWLDQPTRTGGAYLHGLYTVLDRTRREWASLVSAVSHVGGPGDPHQVLLDVVGLHPGSVEWGQRSAESLETLVNRLNLQGLAGFFELLVDALERQAARDLLTRNGYTGEAVPKLLDQVYDGERHRLSGGVIDDRPLSTTAPIRTYTTDGHNYLRWLADAARTGIEALYAQAGFIGDTPPAALLYLLTRHALQLGYHETAIRLHVAAGLYQPAQVAAAYADSSFLHIAEAPVSESRYLPLLSAQPAITGNAIQSVSRYIAGQLGILAPAGDLTVQIAALDLLRDEPTARLEQAFADHIDCCSYRLDAWLLGLVHHQLALMRGLYGEQRPPDPAGSKGSSRLHLGAYAWVENLRPKPPRGNPVQLTDAALARGFAGRESLSFDPTNFGYIHAPSLNHAVAAAVLRNGYERGEGGGALAVNLTPARVRVALAMLEGIRAGQSLSDLLGYRFERGLHDLSASGLEADRYIFPLRQAFPLRANRLASTAVEGVPIETIEASNVLDGLALVEQIITSGQPTYPFGRSDLPAPLTTADRDALTAQAAQLLDTQDAVADLALAEGVYQAVMGNYDRVAATYDAYAHGAFPPEPDVVRTPLSGLGLTQRVALHLDPTASPATSPVLGVPMTPRAQAEPGINAWLAGVLPPLNQIGCMVDFTAAASGSSTTREVHLDQLGLQPVDLMTIIHDDIDTAMSELDDRIVRYAYVNFGVSPAVRPEIRYAATVLAPMSVFEAMPLLRAARTLLTLSRPLTATDLTAGADARSTSDAAVDLDQARIVAVRTALQGLHDDLNTYAGQLSALVTNQPARRNDLLTGIDTLVDQVAGLLGRAAQFGLPQSGWGFAYAARDRGFVALGTAVAGLVSRWQGRITEYNARQAAVAALDPSTPDAERMRLLTQAERAITAAPIMPRPATPGDFQVALVPALTAFTGRLAAFSGLATTTATGAAQLRAAIQTLLPIDTLDSTAGTFTDALAAAEDGLVQLAADALAVVNAVLAAAQLRLAAAADALTQAGTAIDARGQVAARQAAAKALLGDDFVVLPTFRLDSATATVVSTAYAASQTAAPFSHLTTPPAGQEPVQFPVDTWLHGAARVRPKLSAWERLQLFTEAVGKPAPELAALQLPYVAGEPWLGLQFPADHQITEDRLLYTAHFAGGAPTTTGPLCGLLLDEWSEVIPSDNANTGLTFHYDRPNSEAPQSLLLVTPTEFRGAWQFDDLVAALNETLELAKLRGIEPAQIAQTPYAPVLPATVSATQARQLTIAADLALNNALRFPA